MDRSYDKFSKEEFPSQSSKSKPKATSKQTKTSKPEKTIESQPSTQIQAEKRKRSDSVINNLKKQKLDRHCTESEFIASDERHNTSPDWSNNDEFETSSNETNIDIGPFRYTHPNGNESFEEPIDLLFEIKTELLDDTRSTSSTISFDPNYEATSNVSSTSVSHSSHQDKSKEIRQQIKDQMDNINVMSIMNIPQRSDEITDEIFLKICNKLGMKMKFGIDICKTYRIKKDNLVTSMIGVEFKSFERKVNFLDFIRKNNKSVNLKDIFENLPENKSSEISQKNDEIRFRHFKTKYFSEFETHLFNTRARGRKEKNEKIHSFKFTKEGFTFRKTRDSEDVVIHSIEEFDKIINN